MAANNLPEGERKTITALFADIKGSTELMRDLDPEEARAVIDPVLQLMMDAVHRYDGYVVQSAGDGIFALFGAPVAHEDHPQRAVHAAIAMRDALCRRAGDLAGRPAPEIRIGINTGEVVLRLIHTGGHTEYTPVGHAANLAARMQSAAPAGGIVISADTRYLVEGYFELRESGLTEVKGVAEPLNVYEVIGAGPLHGHFDLAVRRGLTKFVGREREFKQMAQALELACSGHKQMVAVVAEAGTGKSRLFYEFKATLPAECKVLEAYSVSHGKASAWLPVLELLRGYFGIQEADDPATRREKVHGTLMALDPALSDVQSYLLALLGIAESPDPIAQMDPQVKRKRTMDALKRIVLRESVKQPVVIIFEDLHWIDGETQALLDLLADSVANARVLLLVNYRPQYSHQWTNKIYYSQLRLDPLGRESAAEMLSTLLGDGAELNPLKRFIIERAEGNPFFLEEMVQALFDKGALVRNGAVKVVGSLSQLRLPPTVQGLLASRIDRLPREHKELVQTLAVMGRESPLALIKRVASQGGGELEPLLSSLQVGEFIYEQPTAAGLEYIFKHALTQEVAYNSLLIERRKLLHERTAVTMESFYSDRLDDHLSELAHHYSCSANARKAVYFLRRAGRQAEERNAYSESLTFLTKGLELLKELPDDAERAREEFGLQKALGWLFYATKGPASAERETAIVRARELGELLRDEGRRTEALIELSNFMQNGGTPATREVAEQALALAECANDAELLASAQFQLGQVLFLFGKFSASRVHCERAFELFGRGPYRNFWEADPARWNETYLVVIPVLLGYPDIARKRSDDLLAAARRSSDPAYIAQALLTDAWANSLLRDAPKVQKRTEEEVAIGAEYGMVNHLTTGTAMRRWALAVQGRADEGISRTQRTRLPRQGGNQGWFRSMQAEAYLASGRLDEGLEAVSYGLTSGETTEQRFYEARLHRLKGELLLMQNSSNIEQAEDCYRTAIAIARRQDAKLFELGATTSLARLLARQYRRDEARTMLADIYNWFTEGFDTADLKEAKALLDELSV
jgi:class 3 adenylate cyclase